MSAEATLAGIPLLPLLAATAAFAAPRAARWIGLSAVCLLLLLSGRLLALVRAHGPRIQSVGGWIPPLGIDVGADGLSALLVLAVAVVGLFVLLYAHGYFGSAAAGHAASPARYFWPLSLFLLASLNALFLSRDIFNLYVTLELNGISAVALVALAGGAAALRASLRYLFVGLTGSLLYLMGVALLYGAYGTVDLALLAKRTTAAPHSLVALVLITVGLMMKSALFPMHFWLPPAHSSAPAPVSALLSALVVKAGFYVLVRIWFEAFGGVVSFALAQIIGAFGIAAVLWGSFQALCQDRLKLLVAYSTVAQLGYLFLLFPLAVRSGDRGALWTGALVLLLSHAAAKGAMFLAAGNIMRATGHDRIRDLDGMTRLLPVSAFAVGLAGVSLIGLPPTAGFVGKWLLLRASLEQGQWWLAAAILGGSLLAAGYVVRILTHAFIRAPGLKAVGRVTWTMEWSAAALALLSVALGLAASGPARVMEILFSRGGGR